MGDWPVTLCNPLPGIYTCSMEALGRMYDYTGVALASTAYPLANLAIFIPFQVCVPVIAQTMYVYNGALPGGNIDVGIYSEDGTRLVSKGSTVKAGASNLQGFNITDTQIGPGKFYLAVAQSGVTALYANTLTTMLCSVLGMAQMAAAFPLPATAVFATCAYGFVPYMAVCVGKAGFL